jgi:Domain of unknown function (DUF4190)/Protein of unknown function (DUF2510)
MANVDEPAGDPSDRPPPAGYYDDPLTPGAQRYWDGSNWGPAAAPPPSDAGPQIVMVERPGTNGLAIASMVLGIVWIYWIGSILAVIFGHIALGQLSRPDNRQDGRGMAIAGLVLGYAGIILAVLLFVVLIIAAEPGP